MRDILAIIGALAIILALLFASATVFDPALVWGVMEALVPKPPEPKAPPPKPTWDPVIWTNIGDGIVAGGGDAGGGSAPSGGERVTTPDGRVEEEWVTIQRWSGSGPKDLGEIAIPSDTWRIDYTSKAGPLSPFQLRFSGQREQGFSDEVGGRHIVYRSGGGRYHVSVLLAPGAWTIAIQVPASAVR